MSSPPVAKKQRTTSSEVQEQNQEEQVPQPPQVIGNEENVNDDQALAFRGMDLTCNEEVPEQNQEEQVLQPQEDMQPDGYDYKRSVQLYVDMLFLKQLQPVPNHRIDQDMRASLIDTVSARATQYPRAIHLAVLIFDQYFENFQPTEGQVHLQPQTVMDVALLIAVKYEYGGKRMAEVLNIHNSDQLEMELAILNVFEWKLSSPTTKTFVDLFLCFNGQDDDTLKFLCWYLMDLSLLDRDCSQFHPSVLAAACGFLAQFMRDPYAKPQAVIPLDYTISDLQTTVLLLRDIIRQSTLARNTCLHSLTWLLILDAETTFQRTISHSQSRYYSVMTY